MKFLYVAPSIEVEPAAVRMVQECLAEHFGIATRQLPLGGIDYAFDEVRLQYRSADVLEKLARMCPADALKVLAVTTRDLFIPVLTFVFGHAQLGGRVAVVSLARLRQEFYRLPGDQAVFRERTRKEALHETGHTFGLVHCAGACAMALSANVQQIDRKPAAFCEACAARVARARKACEAAELKERGS